MFRFLIVLFLLIGIPASQALQVEGWNITEHKKDGQLDSCSMEADFEDGTRVGLIVGANYTWGLLFYNPSWQIKKGQMISARAYTDNNLLADKQAVAIEDNFVVLLLDTASQYRSLQRAHGLRIFTPLGNVSYSLKGTFKAMDAVLRCVQRHEAVPVVNTAEGDIQLPPEQLAIFASNILSASGTVGYKLHPVKNGYVTWDLADGASGGMTVYSKTTSSPDEFLGLVLAASSALCDDMVVAKKAEPTTDGTIVRKALIGCKKEGVELAIGHAIIRHPNSMTVHVRHMAPSLLGPAQETVEEIEKPILAQLVLSPKE